MNRDKLVSVTILVPLSNIHTEDVSVVHTEADRHAPADTEVLIGDIQIDGLGYDIEDYEESYVEEREIDRWRA